jgi:hypothetical protein
LSELQQENSLQFGESDKAAKYWKIEKKVRNYNIFIIYLGKSEPKAAISWGRCAPERTII